MTIPVGAAQRGFPLRGAMWPAAIPQPGVAARYLESDDIEHAFDIIRSSGLAANRSTSACLGERAEVVPGLPAPPARVDTGRRSDQLRSCGDPRGRGLVGERRAAGPGEVPAALGGPAMADGGGALRASPHVPADDPTTARPGLRTRTRPLERRPASGAARRRSPWRRSCRQCGAPSECRRPSPTCTTAARVAAVDTAGYSLGRAGTQASLRAPWSPRRPRVRRGQGP